MNDLDYNFDTIIQGHLEPPTFDSQRETPEPSGQPSGAILLPLLRLTEWETDKQYDRNNPECIHYDFKWKVSQRENIRARQVCSGSMPDVVLAPSDLWTSQFQSQLEDILQDKNKFPGDRYVCETTNVSINIERTRSRGLAESFENLSIDWNMVENHLEGLGGMVGLGKKVTFLMEFIYKECAKESIGSKGRKKKKTATDAQRAQLAAEAGLWARVYKHHRCRGKHCKQGPHCYVDERGIHHKMEARHLEGIFKDFKENMTAGEKDDEVNLNDVEVPSAILTEILAGSKKRKAEASNDSRSCKVHCGQGCGAEGFVSILGDPVQKLKEYCIWILAQTNSPSRRAGLQTANQFAVENLLELNSVIQYPEIIVNSMISDGVKLGAAVQFVSKNNIEKWWKELGNTDDSTL